MVQRRARAKRVWSSSSCSPRFTEGDGQLFQESRNNEFPRLRFPRRHCKQGSQARSRAWQGMLDVAGRDARRYLIEHFLKEAGARLRGICGPLLFLMNFSHLPSFLAILFRAGSRTCREKPDARPTLRRQRLT